MQEPQLAEVARDQCAARLSDVVGADGRVCVRACGHISIALLQPRQCIRYGKIILATTFQECAIDFGGGSIVNLYLMSRSTRVSIAQGRSPMSAAAPTSPSALLRRSRAVTFGVSTSLDHSKSLTSRRPAQLDKEPVISVQSTADSPLLLMKENESRKGVQ